MIIGCICATICCAGMIFFYLARASRRLEFVCKTFRECVVRMLLFLFQQQDFDFRERSRAHNFVLYDGEDRAITSLSGICTSDIATCIIF